jgi:hypothetical protein
MMALDPRYMYEYFTGSKVADNDGRSWTVKDTMPAIAAAIGDTTMVIKLSTTPTALLKQGHDLFPSAIQAAVASDQIKVLEAILQYLVENVKANEVDEWIFNDAVKYAGAELFRRVLKENQNQVVVQTVNGPKKDIRFALDQLETLYKRGSALTWEILLKDGTLDACKLEFGKTPLTHALSKRRYDIARLLLENGAPIDGPSRLEDSRTALWYAASEGYVKDVEFLLRHGAVPDKGEYKPIRAASGSKCEWLLETVMKHGKDYLERPDLWTVYENSFSRFSHF